MDSPPNTTSTVVIPLPLAARQGLPVDDFYEFIRHTEQIANFPHMFYQLIKPVLRKMEFSTPKIHTFGLMQILIKYVSMTFSNVFLETFGSG